MAEWPMSELLISITIKKAKKEKLLKIEDITQASRKQLYLNGIIVTYVKNAILKVLKLLGFISYVVSILPALNKFSEKNYSVSK